VRVTAVFTGLRRGELQMLADARPRAPGMIRRLSGWGYVEATGTRSTIRESLETVLSPAGRHAAPCWVTAGASVAKPCPETCPRVGNSNGGQPTLSRASLALQSLTRRKMCVYGTEGQGFKILLAPRKGPQIMHIGKVSTDSRRRQIEAVRSDDRACFVVDACGGQDEATVVPSSPRRSRKTPISSVCAVRFPCVSSPFSISSYTVWPSARRRVRVCACLAHRRRPP
jgi:hypothetical protein